jgi:endonuclease YncB( thermonuclease family)
MHFFIIGSRKQRTRVIRRRFARFAWVGLAIALLALLGPVVIAQRAVPEIPRPDFSSHDTAEVVRIVDGDTVVLRLRGADTTVRLMDGLFVNLEIVRQGYGHAYTKYPFSHMDLFRFYESKAREAGRGLWGDPAESM